MLFHLFRFLQSLAKPRLIHDGAGGLFWQFVDGTRLVRVAGGDTAAPTLEERQAAVLARLDDPNLTPEEREAATAEATELRTEIEAHNARVSRANEARAALGNLEPITSATPPNGQRRDGNRPADNRPGGQPEQRAVPHIGQAFLESPAFTEYRARGGAGQMFVEFEADYRSILQSLETRALLDSTAPGASFQNPPKLFPGLMTNADRPPRLADLINRGTTTNNTVEYVRETTAAGGGAAAETTEGAAKPEAAYTFEVITDSVRTIAHWIPATRQVLDDNAQLRSYIEGRLMYGLGFRLDAQITNGNGVAPNLRGILQTSGINTLAPIAAEARVITIRKAITLVQVDEYSPTAVVLHPTDWELVELSQDSNGMFRVNPNVASALAPRIWGLNVVATTAIASGTGLVGDFQLGATLWDRQQFRVLASDSHGTFFIENKLVLLAEGRFALSVWRPAAFTSITFNGTT